MKKRNQKGFTLAELLIVVAIIAVLVAIAIPVFTRQLERSRETTDLSNIRSAYAELVTDFLTVGGKQSATVPVKQKQANWQTDNDNPKTYIGTDIQTTGVSGSSSGSAAGRVEVPSKKSGNYKITIDADGTVSVK